jgi:hypothetical protein
MFQVAIQIAPTIRGKLLSPIVLHRSVFKAAQACIAHHPWCSSLGLYLCSLPLGLDLRKPMLVCIRYRRALRFFSVPHLLSPPRSKRCDSCRSGFLSWAVLGCVSAFVMGVSCRPATDATGLFLLWQSHLRPLSSYLAKAYVARPQIGVLRISLYRGIWSLDSVVELHSSSPC